MFQIETANSIIFNIPGRAGGYASNGIVNSRHTMAMKMKPIHQAPTHTLLWGVKPNLKWGQCDLIRMESER